MIFPFKELDIKYSINHTIPTSWNILFLTTLFLEILFILNKSEPFKDISLYPNMCTFFKSMDAFRNGWKLSQMVKNSMALNFIFLRLEVNDFHWLDSISNKCMEVLWQMYNHVRFIIYNKWK